MHKALRCKSWGFTPARAMRGCTIDGFAKMSLQANIFASWYNEMNTSSKGG